MGARFKQQRVVFKNIQRIDCIVIMFGTDQIIKIIFW